MKHLEVNKRTDEETKREELAILDQKHAAQTRYERLKPMAMLAKRCSHFFQVNSFSLAATGVVSYLWFDMGTNGMPLMVLAVVGFALVEYGVDMSFVTLGAMKHDDKVVSKVVYLGLFVSLAISTPSTYYTTEYAIRLLTPSPTLIDTAAIGIEQDVLIKSDTSYWSSQRDKALFAGLAYFDAYKKKDCNDCPWRLSSAKHIQEPYRALTSEVDKMQDSVNTYLARGQSAKASVIGAAISDNNERIKQHQDWCASFGGVLALVSALGILLLIPFRLFFEWWERKYKHDLRGYVSSKVEETNTHTEGVRKEEGKGNDKVKEKAIDNEAPTPIGFAFAGSKEGDILKGEGRKRDRVMVEVSGELRGMTIGDLNRLIKAQTGLERIQHLKTLKSKLK